MEDWTSRLSLIGVFTFVDTFIFLHQLLALKCLVGKS
jgi:hypothetical protein